MRSTVDTVAQITVEYTFTGSITLYNLVGEQYAPYSKVISRHFTLKYSMTMAHHLSSDIVHYMA